MTKLRIIEYLQCFQHVKGISKSLGLFAFPALKKNVQGVEIKDEKTDYDFYFFLAAVVAQSV